MNEMMVQAIAFGLPIAVVLGMRLFNRFFSGSKTNTQAILGILAGVGSSQLGFIPPDVLSALVTGIGAATGIASMMTKRKPKLSPGGGYDDGGGA